MGIYDSNEEKIVKRDEVTNKLAEYGLDKLQSEDDLESVRKILTTISGRNVQQPGIVYVDGEEMFKKTVLKYQRAIVDLNLLLIRQLDRIAKQLEDQK